MKRILFLLALLAALQSNAATLYVRSTDGSDADDGTTWALAKATLAGAFAITAAGDRIWVSDNHAETQASAMTLTSPGTAVSPCEVLCGDDSAEPPTALANTATISTTGNSAISFAGCGYYYGVITGAANAASNGSINFIPTTPQFHIFDSCSLRLNGSSASSRIMFGTTSSSTDDQRIVLINTTLSFASVSQGIILRFPLNWRSTAAALLGTIPTTLFISTAGGTAGNATIIGVDLSAAGSGKSLVDVANPNFNSYIFQDCKLGASVSITTGTPVGQGGTEVLVVNCDSADTNYRFRKHAPFQGDIYHETTIVRTGGASDGTTGFSRKMVTTANSRFFSPLESHPIEIWNETVGSVTVTIYGICLDLPTDAQTWVEVQYPGTSGFPLALFSSDRAANILSTPASQTTDTSAWDGSSSLWTRTNSATYSAGNQIKVASNPGRVFQCTTGGAASGSEPAGYATAVDGDSVVDNAATFKAMNRFKLDTTFTTTGKGMIRVRVMSAGVSATCYYDPQITDGLRQYMTTSGVANEGVGGGATGGSYTFGQ